MKRYLFFWLSLTVLLLLAVAVFNFFIDPYGLFRIVDRPGFNSIKPKAAPHGEMVKAYQVLRIKPRALILGNSRAEVGFDPKHPAWPASARPVYNLALPGTDTSTTLLYLQHVLASETGNPANKPEVAKPEIVVWGIDFMDFLTDGAMPPGSLKLTGGDRRLLANPDGSENQTRSLQQLRDYLESTVTLAAFLDSAQTLLSQQNPYAVDLTPLGFNPMHDYIKITADEGYWNVFQQKDQANTKAYLRRPKDIFNAGGRSSLAFDNLRQVIKLCRQNGISLRLVIYPYHAHLLEIIRITGHWQAFEAWKREVTRIVAEDASALGASPVPLWDFSDFNDLTTEAIPAKGDRHAKMRWYWEAGHFKRELGDLVLTQVLDHKEAANGFGVTLSPANIDAQILSLRAGETAYRQSHAQDVEALELITTQRR
jgi:hypothetical protein